MYLTDQQLRSRLTDFQFTTENTAHPFDPEEQIGPCSIDLRLSGTYWTPHRARQIPFGRRRVQDLERSRIMELSPDRGWQSHTASWQDKITIKPGQMVLARVAERFVMPSDCAGAIEGRSSYARLGLAVHTSGGFINPGWKGHMPLTLYNHSPVTLRIPIGTPLCQLLVIPLEKSVEADYSQLGDRKYVNDVGGPSLWWRDSIMKKLRDRFADVNLDAKAFEGLEELLIDTPDEGVLVRLENFLASQGNRSYGNADELLREFARSEGWRKGGAAVSFTVARAAWTVAVPFLLSLFFIANVASWVWIAAAAATVASILALIWGATRRIPFYLNKGTLSELQLKQQHRTAKGASP